MSENILSYGRKASRFPFKKLAIGIAVVLLIMAGYKIFRKSTMRLNLLSTQKQCLQFTDNDTNPVVRIIGPRGLPSREHPAWPSLEKSGDPQCLLRFEALQDCWEPDRRAASRQRYDNQSLLLFLHEIETPSKSKILIRFAIFGPIPYGSEFNIWAASPATIWRDAARLTVDYDLSMASDAPLFTRQGGRELKLYAGKADPHDSRRFFVKYSADGHDGVIDCKLELPRRAEEDYCLRIHVN